MIKIDKLISVYSSFIKNVNRGPQASQDLSRALGVMENQQEQLKQIRLSLGQSPIPVPQRRGVELRINSTILEIKKLALPTATGHAQEGVRNYEKH